MSAQEYYNPQGSSNLSVPSGPPPPYQTLPQQQNYQQPPPPQKYGFDPKYGHPPPPHQQQQQYPPQQYPPQQYHPQQYPPQQVLQQYRPQNAVNSQRPPPAGYSYSHDGAVQRPQQPQLQPHQMLQQPVQQQQQQQQQRPGRVRFENRPASAHSYLEPPPSRHGDHSRSRSRSHSRSRDHDRAHNHHHRHGHDSEQQSRGGLSTLVGAGGGAIIGDAIFPGLGTVGGALLGGLGGHKVGRDKRARSHSGRVGDRYDREWESSQHHRRDRYD